MLQLEFIEQIKGFVHLYENRKSKKQTKMRQK